MRIDNVVADFKKSVLEFVGYEFEENEENRWSLNLFDSRLAGPFDQLVDCVERGWEEARVFVMDIFGVKATDGAWVYRWNVLSVSQQAKLIMMCFDAKEENSDRDVVAGLVFKIATENDFLKGNITSLGVAIESDNLAAAHGLFAEMMVSDCFRIID
jgi:hypothetical protein